MTVQNVSHAFRMSLFTEKYIFLLAFVLIHICLHPKENEILKRWTQMPQFVAFQLFFDIKRTFSFLFSSVSFSSQSNAGILFSMLKEFW